MQAAQASTHNSSLVQDTATDSLLVLASPLGLPLRLEAAVMTPNDVIFLFLSF